MHLFHDGFQDWVVMILPSSGFFALAAWLLVFNRFQARKTRLQAAAAEGGR